MHPTTALIPDSDLPRIKIVTVARSDASSIFEVHLDGQKYALKPFHDNGDPGYAENGRDLNRLRYEFNACEKIIASGACESGFIP